METNQLQREIDKIQREEEVSTKKLVKKVYLIIFAMIVTLITIIIVEFKEYSFNYQEYKIGKNDLGPRDLVWAGIMGTPPKYYESDLKHGLGYREYETREIRKALEEAGMKLIYRYMSPNRLEFEFERKHPICFYDRKWSNPKEYFKRPHHEILSLALFYSGMEPKKILIRKGERNRYQKHLDDKGNINLTSLIKDKKLKTELIRKVEYDGPYSKVTYGKKQLDGTYYDFIKPKYLDRIDLVILHTNDQIIQMLEKKRFDYQFYDTLEYDDYVQSKNRRGGIDTIIYDLKSVNSIEDSSLIFHSVACGNHSLTREAMPIINEVIKSIRINKNTYDKNVAYTRKLDPLTFRYTFDYSVQGPRYLSSTINDADRWYEFQFKAMKIPDWPMFKDENNILEKRFTKIPQWLLVQIKKLNGEKSLLVLNETDLKSNRLEEVLGTSFLDKDLLTGEQTYLARNEKFLDMVKSINLNGMDVQNIIIFARGLTDVEIQYLRPMYSHPHLRGLTLIESSPYQVNEVLKNVPVNLEMLRFYDVPLMGSLLKNSLIKLKELKILSIHANGFSKKILSLLLDRNGLAEIFEVLTEKIQTISLIGGAHYYAGNWFTNKSVENFAKRKFSQLKHLTLLHFPLNDKQSELILESVPKNLETLIIGSNFRSGGISSIVLEKFLSTRYPLKKLKTLKIHRMLISLQNENKIYLPESLEDFALTETLGITDSNFNRFIFPPKLKLKSLNLSGNGLNDYSYASVFTFLENTLEELNLSGNKIMGTMFSLKNKNKEHIHASYKIKKFSIADNPITDEGLNYFNKLPWEIKELNISNTHITDNSFQYFALKQRKSIESINLSNNHLNSKVINSFLKNHGKNLFNLEISNVLSLDLKTIVEYFSPKLISLNLSDNLLNDQDISILAPKLHKNMNFLDISGSRMSEKGAFILAKHMPELSSFYFSLKFKHSEMGLYYIFSNLSPYLTTISPMYEPLSSRNAILLAKNMPKYLYDFTVPDFELENCKILLSSFPHSLRLLTLMSEMKSTGNTLNVLLDHFPSQLIQIEWGSTITPMERDAFLLTAPSHLLENQSQTRIELSKTFMKNNLRFTTIMNGKVDKSYFTHLDFPTAVRFQGRKEKDVPKGFLTSLDPKSLSDITWLTFENMKLDIDDLLIFMKNIPPDLIGFSLRNIDMQLKDVDKIIQLMPQNLRLLNISENPIGEEGFKKFREFKKKMEEKTGLPFTLREVSLF